MKRNLSLVSAALFGTLVGSATVAHAHIVMEGALKSRTAPGLLPGLDNEQKMSPCDGKRGDGPIYTFEPGATITLQVGETIPHPSYFRIAFDNDGDDGFVEPASIKPIDPSRACPFTDATHKAENDKCMASDFCNVVSQSGGATVLWDNIDPHLASDAKSVTWTLKLPDVECDNCTIQILQVMEDTVHGGYCPKGACDESNYVEDIYHRCIDIKLQKGAGTSGPGNAPGATVSVGTANPKYPNANIDCLAKAGADAGVGASDAGTAGSTSDAAVDSGTGGMQGGTTDAGSGPVSGALGGGTAAGTGSTGGIGGGMTGGATAGTATAGGTTGGGATGAPGTVGNGPGSQPGASDDDDGCSVAFGGSRSSFGLSLALTAVAMWFAARRRRTRS